MIYANIFADGHDANSLFASEDPVHRFNPTYTQRLLRQAFLARDIEINTPDLNRDRNVSFELHQEGRPLSEKRLPRYFIALENPNINQRNASLEYAANFDLSFVWDVRLFHLPNVVPILIPYPMLHEDFPGPEKRDIFSCLINANKAFKQASPSDLYLERIKTIRWYETNAPTMFELYGLGWDKPTPVFDLPGRIRRGLSRFNSRVFGVRPYPSFRGEVKDKASVMRRARFSYCYENSRDLSNYITEKIFDSLVSGCVPVYWGADNILEFLPADCFIDRRQFMDTADVHKYLLSITDEKYVEYQANIMRFLKSDIAAKFSSARITELVVDRICRDLDQHQAKLQ